jgi:E3 ubiquitin-protein ligase CHFR
MIAQQPHGLSAVADLVECPDIFEAFDSNPYEVDAFLDHLTSQDITPRDIYRETVLSVLSSPNGFAPLLEQKLFGDAADDVPAGTPRHRICRMCATEILIWGVRDWWVRERARGGVNPLLMARPDCAEGRACTNQTDPAHTKACMCVRPPLYQKN